MADSTNKKNTGNKGNQALIDPIYKKFTRGVLRAISSTDFYEFFMDAISKADNEFQFSNRKLEKAVDQRWVEEIENALPAIQNIIGNPRNMIREEELVVNAALAKKVGSDVVRHLSQHASLVEDFNERTGDVRPTKVMQKYRDDTEELYENRLVFTTLEMAFHFVKIRHDALFEAMSEEYGAKLKVNSNMESATEQVQMEMFLQNILQVKFLFRFLFSKSKQDLIFFTHERPPINPNADARPHTARWRRRRMRSGTKYGPSSGYEPACRSSSEPEDSCRRPRCRSQWRQDR